MVILSWTEDYGDPNFQGFDLSKLDVDEAYLNASAGIAQKYSLYSKFTECIECRFLLVDKFVTGKLKLQHVPDIIYRLVDKKNGTAELDPSAKYICEFGEDFGEFGVYKLDVVNNSCAITTAKEPVSVAFPALTVALIFCALSLCIYGTVFLYHRVYKKKDEKDGQAAPKKPRVASLDTFRGISIVVMIFINYGAGEYSILDHAVWNGLHLADLVFPWFMWIMGVCIPISLASSLKRNVSKKSIFLTVLKRSIKLFCLGLFLGGGSHLERLRVFGVLQRFGIAYFAATTVCLFLMEQDGSEPKNKVVRTYLKDLFILWKGWVAMLIVFCVYMFIIFFVADDACPQGYFGPGGLHEGGKYKECIGGATGYIDRLILGKHRYGDPTANEVYKSGAFDPEGVLGCLPSIIHVFIGVQAGVTLQAYQGHKDRLIRWMSWGIAVGLIGGALCGFSRDNGPIPVNKNLWSLSFVMVTCCLAFFLLAFCYFIIDVKRWWSGKPFLFAGMNAILMYIGHGICGGHFPVSWYLSAEHGQNTHFFRLFQNVWGSAFWVLVSYYLYKIKYFFTI